MFLGRREFFGFAPLPVVVALGVTLRNTTALNEEAPTVKQFGPPTLAEQGYSRVILKQYDGKPIKVSLIVKEPKWPSLAEIYSNLPTLGC